MSRHFTVKELRQKCFKKNWDELPLYARIITFKFSIPIVRMLYRTRVEPNQVTLASLIVAFVACYFFSRGGTGTFLLGAVLLEFYYVLDCVDGQLARVKESKSREGAFLDCLLNYIVHPAVLFCIGLGHYVLTGEVLFVVVGAVAAWGIVLGNAISIVKYTIVAAALLNGEGRGRTSPGMVTHPGKGKRSPARAIFSFMHKLSTFPAVMNIITVVAVISFVTGSGTIIGVALVFLAVVSIVVAAFRVCNIVVNRKVEKEYKAAVGGT